MLELGFCTLSGQKRPFTASAIFKMNKMSDKENINLNKLAYRTDAGY